jgi:hypothetical protein
MGDELLYKTLFTNLDHAREKIAACTWDYKPGVPTRRLVTALQRRTPLTSKSKGLLRSA